MDRKTFESFCDLIYTAAGISLNEKKEALVSSRIAKRMRALNITEHNEYLRYVNADSTGNEIVQMLDAISTNVTHFFREAHHFSRVTELMKEWLASGQRRFRFWSAGCSSGEEPYTLAVTLLESTLGYTGVDIKILATDISTRILERAVQGEYEVRKMENVSSFIRDKYFAKEGRGDNAYYTVKRNIRNMVLFRRLNLSVVPFPMKGPMDVIFCRNVMIYFDNEVREKLLREFYRLLKPKGYLMVGHAESLTGILSGLKVVEPSVYTRP